MVHHETNDLSVNHRLHNHILILQFQHQLAVVYHEAAYCTIKWYFCTDLVVEIHHKYPPKILLYLTFVYAIQEMM